MRPIAVAAILVGAILGTTGLLGIPLAINGYQYHRADLLSGRNLHISPLWADMPQTGVWLAPQNLTVNATDPPSFRGLPHRVVNLSPLPVPSAVLDGWVSGLIDINVTGDPVNLYIVDEANLTVWENGGSPWMVIAWDYALGHFYIGWGFPREQIKPAMVLILEASNATPPDITVSISLSVSWTPATGAPDAALAAVSTPTLAQAAQDVRLEGNATSANGTLFDLIILVRTSWAQWSQGSLGAMLFEQNASDSVRFIVPLQSPEVQGDSISFVVRNPGYSNLNIDVNVSSEIVWWEPPLASARPLLGTLGVVLGFAGVAVAAGGVLLEVTPFSGRQPNEQPKSSRP